MRDAVRTGGVAALLVIAAGAAATGLALALRAGVATDMLREYRTGVVGQAGLALVCLVYAPNVAVWGASYLVGPGFAFGVGTTVSAAAVTLGPVLRRCRCWPRCRRGRCRPGAGCCWRCRWRPA